MIKYGWTTPGEFRKNYLKGDGSVLFVVNYKVIPY